MSAILSLIARRKKIRYFLQPLNRQAVVLEIGCGEGWVGNYLKKHGFENYTGVDVIPPADIVGDIRCWRELGLNPAAFDVIIAFEILEHVDCLQDCYDLLAPGGKLLLTTPLPVADGLLKMLERLGLTQKRCTPHNHLRNYRDLDWFGQRRIKIVAFASQWVIFTKPSRLL